VLPISNRLPEGPNFTDYPQNSDAPQYAGPVTASEPDYAPAEVRGLRAQREATAVSLRELARRSGYSTSYLSRVETGKRTATKDIVRLYASLPSLAPLTKNPDDAREPHSQAPTSRPGHGGGLGLGIVWYGAELRRFRMAAGMSLEALGAEVYLSRAYLGKIEQGYARGSYQQALALDNVLKAEGGLARLFLDECARVGPVAPDIGILASDDSAADYAATDPQELAVTAAVRLEGLRIRSHEEGPNAVLRDLGESVAALYQSAVVRPTAPARPIWQVALRYAELLGWTAQETGHDDIALRWTRAAADWARAIGDDEAWGYALIRQSQWSRRRGDAEAAIDYAREAGAVPRISPRIAQFAAQREAQACALAGDEEAFRQALDRSYELADRAASPGRLEDPDPSTSQWGPLPDPAFEGSRLLEATCLVDLGDFVNAASLFSEHMDRLGSARTGYARIAVRQAIAYAYVNEPEQACEVALGFLPTVARQGSASLRADLNRLTRALNRYRRKPAVSDLLPDLAMLARTAGSVSTA
jgi:transcriptional regulator with XRE-family HTH domain